jgi:hypothetical protein
MTKDQGQKIVCIFGNSRCGPEALEYQEAEQLGRLLAEANVTVCTGGYDGIMEAASRGARQAGGEVIGVTVDIFDGLPNSYLTREIRVPDLFTRLKTMADLADGFVGLRGSIGTITEVALMWNLLVIGCFDRKKPLVLIGPQWRRVVDSWATNLAVDGRDVPHVILVDNAVSAHAWLEKSWLKK